MPHILKAKIEASTSKAPYRAIVIGKKPVLKIEYQNESGRWLSTPGQWYLSTLLNTDGYGSSEFGSTISDVIAIDAGANWYVSGMKEAIREALAGIFEELEF